MRMTLWVAALLPITIALAWEAVPFPAKRRAIQPWVQIASFAWMALLFALTPWLE